MPDVLSCRQRKAHAKRRRVDLPLEEIADGGHAINVQLSAEEVGTSIACRVVTEGVEAQELTIALGELNGSGHVGIAWLGTASDQTGVNVTLIEPAEMQ